MSASFPTYIQLLINAPIQNWNIIFPFLPEEDKHSRHNEEAHLFLWYINRTDIEVRLYKIRSDSEKYRTGQVEYSIMFKITSRNALSYWFIIEFDCQYKPFIVKGDKQSFKIINDYFEKQIKRYKLNISTETQL